MKRYFYCILAMAVLACENANMPTETEDYKESFTLSREELKDKIKGGWAAQTIGVTFGGPTEFQYNGTMIQDYEPLVWYEDVMLDWYQNAAGLYDDVYMDLTFVDVFEKYGMDAPAKSFAEAFAHAGYPLWHANQAARYNILNGIMPPESGHYFHNPHADCIDFQIEADFAGLMCPGMVNTASEICDRVGHIMNHGDGWYGGVYVASMYSLAFYSDNIDWVVKEALTTIPEQSEFYQCMNDVINWHQQFPDDWKRTWFEVEKKWSEDIGCPDGVFRAFNIDAKVNAAYVLIGLLYGNGDIEQTMEISTRCGQDSDCNPATAAGILGTMQGYSQIPAKWKNALVKVEDMDFKYTTISLNDAYDLGYNHALKMIADNGGIIDGDSVQIMLQKPNTVAFEDNFENLYPRERRNLRFKTAKVTSEEEFIVDFSGKGIVITGWSKAEGMDYSQFFNTAEVYLDGELDATIKLPINFTTRRTELYWNYQLSEGDHSLMVRLLNKDPNARLEIGDVLIYQ